ncbi:MAG: response regulator, partial [Deltaproteobacteria bacterium]
MQGQAARGRGAGADRRGGRLTGRTCRAGDRLKEYILVVDDEQSLRQLLKLFLEKEGYAVDAVSSLAEAEKAIFGNVYDLVLTDL